MICVNELTRSQCASKEVLEPLAVLLAPFAPHMAEQLWHDLGHSSTVCDAPWPRHDERHLVETTVNYPVQINGKVRFTLTIDAAATPAQVEAAALADPAADRWIEGRAPRKVIVVPGRIVNIVL